MGSLVFKLLFKAMVALVLMLGVVGYGHHLRGGDPAAVFGRAGAGIAERFADLGRDARDGAGRTADAVAGLGRGGGGDGGDGQGGPRRLTEVSTWVDADGLVHYSNAGDVPAGARLMRIDPDTNVLAPLPVAPVTAAIPGAIPGPPPAASPLALGGEAVSPARSR